MISVSHLARTGAFCTRILGNKRASQNGITTQSKPRHLASHVPTALDTSSIGPGPGRATESAKKKTVRESEWREDCREHAQRIHNILSPGMLPVESSSGKKNRKRKVNANTSDNPELIWMGLDPKNPVYNFLIEYYGLKGTKGCRRLSRWSPGLDVLLEKANANDFGVGGSLHLRGAIMVSGEDEAVYGNIPGVLYSPSHFFHKGIEAGDGDDTAIKDRVKQASAYIWYRTILKNTLNAAPVLHCFGLHEWAMLYHPRDGVSLPPPSARFQQHLPLRVDRDTINSLVEEKGVSCTHFDAMRFFAPASIPLINDENQCKGGCKSEVDNKKTAILPFERTDQIKMEQPGCVHAHMDLLKIALKLSPFLSSDVLGDVLEVSIRARKLDVAASPYDSTICGLDPVKVETLEGRKVYKEQQTRLMLDAQVVRESLLCSYDDFLSVAFDPQVLDGARTRIGVV